MASAFEQQFNYELQRLRNYINYINDIDRQYKNIMGNYSMQNHYKPIDKTQDLLKFEKDIAKARQDATQLYNELERIRSRCQCNLNIEQDLRNYINRANSVQLPIFGDINVWYKEEYLVPEEDYDVEEGVPTGAAANFYNSAKQKTAELVIGNNYGGLQYVLAKTKYGPDTAGMLDLGHEKRNDTNYEKDAIKLTNWDDYRVASEKTYLKKLISGQFKEYNFDINKIPGYFFKSYSDPSKRIAKNSEFLKTLQLNHNKILRGTDVGMEFQAPNLHYSLGHIYIRNGYLDQNGNLHIKVYDTYDFNKKDNTPLIKAGKEAMMRGEIKPFFTIHDIIIPKEVINKLWE